MNASNYRARLVAACLMLSAALFPAFGQTKDAASLLKAADSYRTRNEGVQVETVVRTYKRDGSLDKERLYTVFAQAKRRTLVLMQSAVDRGEKLLMLGDDFWLLMPGSSRPLRITPNQKLLGDASSGDIATLSWSDAYEGRIVGEERCGDDVPCVHLSLQATSKGVSYQRIELWLGQRRHEPIKADLYVQSDKLAKQARFVMDKQLMTDMLLLDHLSSHMETRVSYVSRKSRVVPESWLNPMFLANNPSLD